MSEAVNIYLYDPLQTPPLRIVRATAPTSGEQTESTYGVTMAGVKCARRIIDARKWWEYGESSSIHMSCCRVKGEDVCGGDFSFGDNLSEAQVDEFGAIIRAGQQDLVDAEADSEVTGWGTWEIIPKVGGGIARINHLPSFTCWISKSREQVVHTYTGQAGSSTIYPLLGKGSAREAQVGWVNNSHYPFNSYYGVPDVWTVIKQIEAIRSAIEWNRDFFKKHGGYRWAFFLKSPDGRLDATADEKLLEMITKHLTDIKGKDTDVLTVPVGDRELTIHKLDADAQEMSWSDLLAVFRGDILSAHRVPPDVVGMTRVGALGGDVVEESADNYLKRVVAPKQRRWAKAINDMFRVYYGVEAEFSFGIQETVDLTRLAYPISNLAQNHIIPLNEARELLGMDPLPELEGLYVQDFTLPNDGSQPDLAQLQRMLNNE